MKLTKYIKNNLISLAHCVGVLIFFGATLSIFDMLLGKSELEWMEFIKDWICVAVSLSMNYSEK